MRYNLCCGPIFRKLKLRIRKVEVTWLGTPKFSNLILSFWDLKSSSHASWSSFSMFFLRAPGRQQNGNSEWMWMPTSGFSVNARWYFYPVLWSHPSLPLTLYGFADLFFLSFLGMLISFFLTPFVITFYSCWSEHIHFHQAVWWLKHFNPEFNPSVAHIHLTVLPSLWRTQGIQAEKGRRRYSCLSSLDFRCSGYCSKGHSCWKAQCPCHPYPL